MAADPHDPHSLTLATARGRRLCKTRHADGAVEDYDAARTLDFVTTAAPDLGTLATLLRELIGRRDTCVVRGAIRDPQRARGVRRLLHPDPDTGEAPTLAEAPRAWLALDLDGLPLPEGTDPRDLALCGDLARATLPEAFHGAACIVGATAGHGFKDGARLRLWFLLGRALSGAECKRWLRHVPIDLSVFGAVQPIYTAAPVFRGMADPLPARLTMLDGAARVVPPSAAALAPPARALGRGDAPIGPDAPGAGRYASRALARAFARVSAAPIRSRHPTAVSEAWGLARLVAAGLLSGEELARAMDGALQAAGKPAGEGAKIAAWAVAQRAGGAA